jgi:hypothetical protein
MEDNMEMLLTERGSGDMDWIDLADERGQWRALFITVISL